ncbi:FadR/GntR family transcriptional regulator [Asticcacaulis sp. EMRT-3]|uniref:FadR/GntR family transcriptional regulator n=1 Tax=Asticcacaulis sp. EMRT-3 TaxID=3040349 RepID=UPI0024AFA6D6|nr:FadR/GntR family transcriptional regulator [Asticcacaulis sp. EMRT-3]MDI7776631.1 FadR/GntR family transcriptional regulator [Asticcacaulis sp. EMRT-3]
MSKLGGKRLASDSEDDALTPGKPGELHTQLAQKLGIDILGRRWLPGEVLPSEIDMANMYAISRSAVREAIRTLAAKGIVEPRRKRGTCVTDRAQWNMLDPVVLSWMFASTPDEQLVKNLFEMRLILEPAAARLAAQRRTDAHLDAMSEALKGMARHTLLTDAGLQADMDFHSALMAAAGNEQLSALNASIGATVALSTRYKIRHNLLGRDPVPAHLAVFEAIQQRDAEEAHWCMQYLVRLAVKDLLHMDALEDLPSKPFEA